jgi:hypothetical protein
MPERGFLGPEKVKKQSLFEPAKSHEEKRALNPRIAAAAKRKWPRIAAITRLTDFWKAYREALSEYCAGDHSVIFPAGTLLDAGSLWCPLSCTSLTRYRFETDSDLGSSGDAPPPIPKEQLNGLRRRSYKAPRATELVVEPALE